MEVLLVGEALSVQRASEIGFVNKILPVGQQRQGALDYAHRIVANAPFWNGPVNKAFEQLHDKWQWQEVPAEKPVQFAIRGRKQAEPGKYHGGEERRGPALGLGLVSPIS